MNGVFRAIPALLHTVLAHEHDTLPFQTSHMKEICRRGQRLPESRHTGFAARAGAPKAAVLFVSRQL
jgi:hypothetical protein